MFLRYQQHFVCACVFSWNIDIVTRAISFIRSSTRRKHTHTHIHSIQLFLTDYRNFCFLYFGDWTISRFCRNIFWDCCGKFSKPLKINGWNCFYRIKGDGDWVNNRRWIRITVEYRMDSMRKWWKKKKPLMTIVDHKINCVLGTKWTQNSLTLSSLLFYYTKHLHHSVDSMLIFFYPFVRQEFLWLRICE